MHRKEIVKRPKVHATRLQRGVFTRLLIAFFVIAALSVLAVAAANYAFREVGGGLERIDEQVQPTLSALELARSAERIIGLAPAILVINDPAQSRNSKKKLSLEIESLNRTLDAIVAGGMSPQRLERIEVLVERLINRLTELEQTVEQRRRAIDRGSEIQNEVHKVNSRIQRLFKPWVDVTAQEINGRMRNWADLSDIDKSENLRLLDVLVGRQERLATTLRHVSNIVEMLLEGLTTQSAERLKVLEFQIAVELARLDQITNPLAPQLRRFLNEHVSIFRELSEGPDGFAATRRQALNLTDAADLQLTQAVRFSEELTAAVDRLGAAAKQDIATVVNDALSVQRQSGRFLVAIAILSTLGSFLIVWLYVGGSIVRRLKALRTGMLEIAEGNTNVKVDLTGDDEITAMGHALDIFKRNTQERDRLLSEKERAAELMEEEIRQRTSELEVANKFKARFLAAAGHDIRQPLHALNLFVARLRKTQDSYENHKLIPGIKAAVASMNEQFEELFNISKLEAGVLEAEISNFAAERLLARLETTFCSSAEEKGLRFKVVQSSLWVSSDFILLERILNNIVSNAIRYTNTGGVLVGCRACKGHARFEVYDTGQGLSQSQTQLIFQEFVQLPEANSAETQGLGLGLAIVEKLASLLDHQIEVTSEEGAGTRISITVPRVANEEAAPMACVSNQLSPDPLKDLRILVIDDNCLALQAIVDTLRSWGSHVSAARSATEAISDVQRLAYSPDVIIADYSLEEGWTGVDAIVMIKKTADSDIPSCVVSGETDTDTLEHARKAGFPVLKKPVSPMALRATLTALVRDSRTTALKNV